MLAAAGGAVSVTQQLVERGADADHLNVLGKTAFRAGASAAAQRGEERPGLHHHRAAAAR